MLTCAEAAVVFAGVVGADVCGSGCVVTVEFPLVVGADVCTGSAADMTCSGQRAPTLHLLPGRK